MIYYLQALIQLIFIFPIMIRIFMDTKETSLLL
jgi:hypothetical protein